MQYVSLSFWLNGGASGSLPGKVTIANSTGFNDLFQGLTYGSTSVVNYSTAGSAIVTPALAPAPEPSGLVCGIMGIAGVGLLICRKRKFAHDVCR